MSSLLIWQRSNVQEAAGQRLTVTTCCARANGTGPAAQEPGGTAPDFDQLLRLSRAEEEGKGTPDSDHVSCLNSTRHLSIQAYRHTRIQACKHTKRASIQRSEHDGCVHMWTRGTAPDFDQLLRLSRADEQGKTGTPDSDNVSCLNATTHLSIQACRLTRQGYRHAGIQACE